MEKATDTFCHREAETEMPTEVFEMKRGLTLSPDLRGNRAAFRFRFDVMYVDHAR
jgi:hypothetical protein